VIRCPRCQASLVRIEDVCGACGWCAPRNQGIPLLAPELAYATDGFEIGQHAVLADGVQGHFWYEGRNALILWALRRHFPQARSFCEVGCGTGYVSAAIERACPRLRLTAAEASIEAAVLTARRLQSASVLQADARAWPFEEEFDVAGAFDVIEHIDDDEQALRNLYASVRPGGGVLITVPQHRWLWHSIDDFSRHKRRYRRTELRAKVRAAGFQVLQCVSFNSLLLPLMMASRLRSRLVTVGSLSHEENIPRPLNAVFRRVMDVERVLIRAGVAFPAGGSILLAGRKSPRREAESVNG